MNVEIQNDTKQLAVECLDANGRAAWKRATTDDGRANVLVSYIKRQNMLMELQYTKENHGCTGMYCELCGG